MRNSELPTNLINNYLATHYQIGAGAEIFTLYINQYSKALLQQLSVHQKDCAAIITGYNPLSQMQSHERNLIANTKLLEVLENYSDTIIQSVNIDPSGNWSNEESFFISGLSLTIAKSIGQQFNQNAIVWTDNRAIPQLILLR
ncbi:MAG: DUF3293 domain-containing protein [Nitrosomonas sp.]|nr:DUF3293 domain-containing protein [Nitrosomonas sp.]